MKYEVAFVSIVPSPYQRDLFQALARRSEVGLSVFYLEAASPDSPWPRKPLEPYEEILRGFWFGIPPMRCHVNWPLPNLDRFDVVVMNSLVSLTAQWLMRTTLRNKPWIFWGERLSRRGPFRKQVVAPLHRASAIASIGRFALEDYRERFPEPRHLCIPYHCNLAPFLAASRRPRNDGPVVFLFCGQMIARKGVDLLLTAFQQLDQKHHCCLSVARRSCPRCSHDCRSLLVSASFTADSNRQMNCLITSLKLTSLSSQADMMAGALW